MARCIRCNRLKLFGSFPGGYCPECTAAIQQEAKAQEDARRAAEAEAAKAEQVRQEQARIDAERKQISLTRVPDGKLLAYTYEDVDMFLPDPNVRTLPAFKPGVPFVVSQDTANVHDPHAVSLSLNGQIIGYLYRNQLQDMANDYLSRGDHVRAVLRDAGTGKQAHLLLEFYDDLGALGHLLKNHPHAKPFRLTGNTGTEMQENIFTCSKGDECSLEYDAEKDKYLVIDLDAIGYLPTSAAKIVAEHGEDHCAVYVADTDTSDSGKEIVSVYVLPQS